MMLPCEGDRIRVIRVADDPVTGDPDPCPIEPGAEGTVTAVVVWSSMMRGAFSSEGQLHVEWDDGRTLALLVGTDEWEVIGLTG